MAERIGTITGLWRYPVKSMGGEAVGPVAAGERGLAGDRGWAIVDAETGKVASAKRPKLWLRLLECSATYVDEPAPDAREATTVRITLPDGAEVRTDDPDRDRLLSEAIGRPVTMVGSAPPDAAYELSEQDAEGVDGDPDRLTESRVGLVAPEGTLFDTVTLHVIPTSSLDTLAGEHPGGTWDRRRFRPNVLVELDDPPAHGFAENDWPGHTLRFGDEACAVALAPMPRCVMTTLPQGDLERDPLILRTMAERNRREIPGHGTYACVGAMTNVSVPGTLAVGDPVSLAPA